jgi:hypothetical protein
VADRPSLRVTLSAHRGNASQLRCL